MRPNIRLFRQAMLFLGYVFACLVTTIGLYVVDCQYHTQYTLWQFTVRFLPLQLVFFVVMMSVFDVAAGMFFRRFIRRRHRHNKSESVDLYIKGLEGQLR